MALPTVSGRGFIIGEIRSGTAKNGNIWVGLAISANKPEKDANDNWVPTKELKEKIVLQATAWGKTAEFILENFETQTDIDFSGQIYESLFTKDDGTEIRRVELKLQTVGHVEPRNGNGGSAPAKKKPAAKRASAADEW